jgi:hypothetical protein
MRVWAVTSDIIERGLVLLEHFQCFFFCKTLEAEFELHAIQAPSNKFIFVHQGISVKGKVQSAGVLVGDCEGRSLEWRKSRGPGLRRPPTML